MNVYPLSQGKSLIARITNLTENVKDELSKVVSNKTPTCISKNYCCKFDSITQAQIKNPDKTHIGMSSLHHMQKVYTIT